MEKQAPAIIYGTAWKEDRTKNLVEQALNLGYRGIDTANQRKHYNEALAGEAVQNWIKKGNDRSELFIQSKFTHIAGQDHRLPYNPSDKIEDQVKQSFESTLSHFAADFLDSYLIHGPSSPFTINEEDWKVWKTLELLYSTGKTKAIGISNTGIKQLKMLYEKSEIKPMIVQNRCYANTLWDREVREFCTKNEIMYQGFSLLTANPHILQHPVVENIAARHNKTRAQVIFRLSELLGITPLTGTTSAKHMEEDQNFSDIDIRENEFKLLSL